MTTDFRMKRIFPVPRIGYDSGFRDERGYPFHPHIRCHIHSPGLPEIRYNQKKYDYYQNVRNNFPDHNL